jgi:hypothetical protein
MKVKDSKIRKRWIMVSPEQDFNNNFADSAENIELKETALGLEINERFIKAAQSPDKKIAPYEDVKKRMYERAQKTAKEISSDFSRKYNSEET